MCITTYFLFLGLICLSSSLLHSNNGLEYLISLWCVSCGRLLVWLVGCFTVLYTDKEEIHSEIELIIYLLKWYSPTNIISLALLVLRLKLVLLLTEIFQYSLCLRNTASFVPPRYPEVTGYEPRSGHIDTAIWMHYMDANQNGWRRN